jgi:UDP-N-acetylglucosamine 4-epimerase
MTIYEQLRQQLPQQPKTWRISGVAGLIGSNLLQSPLELDHSLLGAQPR